jgi:hypothetical protein
VDGTRVTAARSWRCRSHRQAAAEAAGAAAVARDVRLVHADGELLVAHRRHGHDRAAGVTLRRRAGQTTTASWPRRRRCSTTLQRLVVTPLRVGRNDSVTTATLMAEVSRCGVRRLRHPCKRRAIFT